MSVRPDRGVDLSRLPYLVSEQRVSLVEKDEAVDLTKSSVKSSAASDDGLNCDRRATDESQPLGCSGNRNIEAAKTQLSFQSGGDDLTFGTQAANGILTPLLEQSTMDQIKRYLGKRSEQSKHQLEWENHLRSWENRLRSWESRLQSWEMQLKSKEETFYWRDRCLQSELGINSASNLTVLNSQQSKESNVSSCDNGALTLASSEQPQMRLLRDTLTPSTAVSSSCPSAIVSSGLWNSGVKKDSRLAASVISEEMPESQLNRSFLQGNKNFSLAHPLNQLANNLCVSQVVKESGGKLDGEQLNLSKSYGVCGSTVSSSVQSVSVMSLITSNQGVPMIVPFILQQHLVPLAQSLNPDTGVLIRNCLDSKSPAKGAALLNVADGLEAKKCSLGENTKILSAQSDSDKSLHYNEGNSRSKVNGLGLQILEPTEEKSKEAVNLEKETEQEQDREQTNKVPVSVLDCAQSADCVVENSDSKRLDFESPESNKSLRAVSCYRNSQKGHRAKYDTTTLVGCAVASDRPDARSESRNCQFISTIPAELKPEAVPKALQKIIVSFPQVSLSVSSGQTATWARSKSTTDFTNWLRAKTEFICKEESLEGRKNAEDSEDRSIVHCSEDEDNRCSSKSEPRIQTINQDDSHNHLQHDLNLLSVSDANSVLVSSSPVPTPQVPLVVENENDFFETDSVDDSVTKSSGHSFSSANLVKKRKQSFEKQNSFKKVFVDALL